MTGVLIKRGYLDTNTHTQGEHCVNMKVEIRVMCLLAREGQGLLANHQRKQTGPGKILFPQTSEGTNPAGALTLDFLPPELGDNTFLSFKRPSVLPCHHRLPQQTSHPSKWLPALATALWTDAGGLCVPALDPFPHRG